jgi:hypothetical protein
VEIPRSGAAGPFNFEVFSIYLHWAGFGAMHVFSFCLGLDYEI